MPDQMPLIENIESHKANIALAQNYGSYKVERAVVDGQRGYSVTNAAGTKCFHFSLGDAFRQMLRGIGHGDDRDLFIMGEPEKGNAW